MNHTGAIWTLKGKPGLLGDAVLAPARGLRPLAGPGKEHDGQLADR
jgi:hypothetical protein